ncbi:MAG: hypothetical protein ACI9U0_000052 [Flavobacteriales bacterium]|jgi:hypothetical protein
MHNIQKYGFLEDLRHYQKFKYLVVHIITTWFQNFTIYKPCQYQVSECLVKTLDFERFKITVKKLDNLWGVLKLSNLS